MKALGYDVTTLGNHEFDYGPSGLAAAIDAANVAITGLPTGLPPIVASNIHFSGFGLDIALVNKYDPLNTDPTKPIHGRYVITTANGLKIGFIGIMGADAAAVAPAAWPVTFSVAAGSTVDNRIASLAQIFDDVKPAVDSLRRDDKVDLVVALSHGGANPDSTAQSEDRAIAENVAGIDVVVSGHSHTDVPVQLFTNRYTGRQVAVQQAGRFGDTVGRIALTVNGDGTVSFDTAGSALVAVDDRTTPSDATINTVVGATITALESQNIPGQSFSFLKYTLAQILHGTPPALVNTGDYYNFKLVTLPFDVDNTSKLQETELLDLSADSLLAAANLIAPTDIAVEAAGVVRTPALKKGLTGKLGFADLFTAVPLGGSPSNGTPGYPLLRFGIFLAEVKAAFEVTAGFAYTGHNDLFVVPSGFKFEYDTTRKPFNPTGDPTDPMNGRVTRIWQLKPAALAAGTFDGPDATTWDLKFDGRTSASPGFTESPLTIKRVVASLYIAAFATFAGVKLKDPTTGAPVAGNDPTKTILLRPVAAGSTEIKQWEALGGYVHSFANLPAIYNKDDPATVLPRRAICVGANSSNPAGGNCSQ
jgi:5'-nucleotidase